jgi:8-oxo-dGTP pyrophosphatase MutT (NUDIX family)
MTLPVIHRATTLDLAFRPRRWPFAEERRAEIDAHFVARQRDKAIWNGRVLVARDPGFAGQRFSASYFETDFASYLAWRDWGFPDREVFSAPGIGALRGSDGAFVLGEMSAHTANAGRIYFPAGTPDSDDIRDGAVDIDGNIAREVEEETGLTPADYRPRAHWDCVVGEGIIALIKVLDVDLTGEQLRARIDAHLAGQPQPELCAIHLVRDIGDITSAMPRYIPAFVAAQMSR